MQEKNADLSRLPMLAMEYIPTPNENAKKIISNSP